MMKLIQNITLTSEPRLKTYEIEEDKFNIVISNFNFFYEGTIFTMAEVHQTYKFFNDNQIAERIKNKKFTNKDIATWFTCYTDGMTYVDIDEIEDEELKNKLIEVIRVLLMSVPNETIEVNTNHEMKEISYNIDGRDHIIEDDEFEYKDDSFRIFSLDIEYDSYLFIELQFDLDEITEDRFLNGDFTKEEFIESSSLFTVDDIKSCDLDEMNDEYGKTIIDEMYRVTKEIIKKHL